MVGGVERSIEVNAEIGCARLDVRIGGHMENALESTLIEHGVQGSFIQNVPLDEIECRM